MFVVAVSLYHDTLQAGRPQRGLLRKLSHASDGPGARGMHVGDAAARVPGSQRLAAEDVLPRANEAAWDDSAMRLDWHEQSSRNKPVVDR